ncbi:MAG: nucleotidyltransferase domain-containing protein [Oscillospiraceae bacterium]|jgi:predicted nucleotidyltransferase|nr:nucleotidyltransferase domain-containing protein [Oscillospiraceae bacterium]
MEAIYNAIKQNLYEELPVGIKEVWLFGSYARGEERINSDIDIMIVHNDEISLYNDILPVTSDITYNLYNKYDIYCSFISTDEESFSQYWPLFNTIRKEGLLL